MDKEAAAQFEDRDSRYTWFLQLVLLGVQTHNVVLQGTTILDLIHLTKRMIRKSSNFSRPLLSVRTASCTSMIRSLQCSTTTSSRSTAILPNPTSGSNYAFTYQPYPSMEATTAWASAPQSRLQPIDIWLTHGAPRGRLDKIPIPGLMGCEAQRRIVAAARPLLCVFGHYYVSYGVEKVVWPDGVTEENGEGIANSFILTGKEEGSYDFTDLRPGEESVFVNAAWMTGEKRLTEKRNKPIVIDLMASLQRYLIVQVQCESWRTACRELSLAKILQSDTSYTLANSKSRQ